MESLAKIPAIPKVEEAAVAPAADSFQKKSVEKINEKKKEQKIVVQKESIIQKTPVQEEADPEPPSQYTLPEEMLEEAVEEQFERIPCPICNRKFNGEERLVRPFLMNEF